MHSVGDRFMADSLSYLCERCGGKKAAATNTPGRYSDHQVDDCLFSLKETLHGQFGLYSAPMSMSVVDQLNQIATTLLNLRSQIEDYKTRIERLEMNPLDRLARET